MSEWHQPTTPEGELMYQLRIQADKTQLWLEQVTGVGFTTWSKFESGARARPTPVHIELFVKALNLSDEVWDQLVALREQPCPLYEEFRRKHSEQQRLGRQIASRKNLAS